MGKKRKLIAVIPAHNEEKHISEVVKQAKKYVDVAIVVNDASKDKTKQLAEEAGAIVLTHVVNLGLGGTLKTGCDAALLLGADMIVTLDGDGQHNPHEIPNLVAAMDKNNAEAIFGERAFDENMPLVKKIGNLFFHIYSKYFFGIKVRDTQTGFRLFTAEAYKKIRWTSRDYAVASEMLINAEKNHVRYFPQRVATIYHDDYKGTTILDGIKIANKMLGLKLKR